MLRAYRLTRGNSEFVSDDIPVRSNAERYWLVRVDPKGGGAGAGELRLDIGWVPQEVVFAARGRGPFALAFGNASAKKPAVEGTKSGGGPPPPDAVRATVGAVSASALAPPSPFREPARFARTFVGEPGVKKLAIASALFGGAVLLSWIALRRRRKAAGAADKRQQF